MESDREIEGTEFDWFAVDERGQFALFATAGSGPVPESIRGHVASHDAIGDSLEVSGWGNAAVWHSYSNAGLFAYDWSSSQGRYVRVAEPGASLSASLAASLAFCPGLPAFRLSFAHVSAVEPSWQGGT